MKQRSLLLFAAACLAAWQLACAGGSGGGSISQPPPPPSPVINSVSITPLTATATAGSSSPISFAATVKGSSLDNHLAVAWSVNGVPDGNSTVGTVSSSGTNAEYQPPASVSAQMQVTLQAAATDGTASGSGQAMITVTQPVTPPTGSISPAAASVVLGGTQEFTVTVNGAASDPTCTSQQYGNVPVSGGVATYTVPVPTGDPPTVSSWTDVLTCSASNSAGSWQGSATVTLTAPTPTISSIDPANIYVNTYPNLFFAVQTTVNGSGYMTGSDLEMTPDQTPSLLEQNLSIAWNKWVVITDTLARDEDPGFYGFTVASPTGHGGGISGVAYQAILGDQNMLTFNGTDALFIDQSMSLTVNTLKLYKLADGSPDGSITGANVSAGISLDDKTNYLLWAINQGIDPASSGVGFYDPTKGYGFVGFVNLGTGISSVGAAGGYGCATEYRANALVCFPVVAGSSTATTAAVAGVPWDVQLATLNGNLTAVVWSVESDALSSFSVPGLNETGSVALTGLTPQSQLVGYGGWQLQVFDAAGPSQGTAALLASYEKAVIFVDLATMTETKRVALTGAAVPFRLSKNDADGSVVVALADPTAGLTRFVRVAPDGTTTALKSTVPFLATGFAVSADGTKLYCGNRGQFKIVANQ
jgi:hypothetical protein